MVTVGIDPHKHVHVAVAVDGSGTRIGKQVKVKNGRARPLSKVARSSGRSCSSRSCMQHDHSRPAAK